MAKSVFLLVAAVVSMSASAMIPFSASASESCEPTAESCLLNAGFSKISAAKYKNSYRTLEKKGARVYACENGGAPHTPYSAHSPCAKATAR